MRPGLVHFLVDAREILCQNGPVSEAFQPLSQQVRQFVVILDNINSVLFYRHSPPIADCSPPRPFSNVFAASVPEMPCDRLNNVHRKAQRIARNRRSSREFVTTLTELSAIAAPAITGLTTPNAASGIPSVL